MLVLVSNVAHRIEGMLGLKRKKNIKNYGTLLDKDISYIIIPFHIHNAADAISSFYGRGKPWVFDSAKKSEEAQ